MRERIVAVAADADRRANFRAQLEQLLRMLHRMHHYSYDECVCAAVAASFCSRLLQHSASLVDFLSFHSSSVHPVNYHSIHSLHLLQNDSLY